MAKTTKKPVKSGKSKSADTELPTDSPEAVVDAPDVAETETPEIIATDSSDAATETPEPVEAEVTDAPTDPVEEPNADDPVSTDETNITALPVVQQTETRRGGFWPLVLGGLVAAVLGFVAARADLIDQFLPPSWRAGAEQTALADDLQTANDQIARLKGDIADLKTEITSQDPVDTQSIEDTLSQLTNRIATLEDRPIPDASGTNTGTAPNYDAEFAALQETAAAQQAEIDKLLADARLVERSTEDAANKTLARAAASRIIAAIESGAPFAAALSDLETAGTVEIPQELQDAAASGVTPLATLQSEMPDAARIALAASRRATGETTGGLGGFLKRSLGARSVEPREGTDPDAVLSRIEDAVRNGRLTDALAEAETLPPEGQAAMAQWLDQARTRNSVLSASETLMQRLAAN